MRAGLAGSPGLPAFSRSGTSIFVRWKTPFTLMAQDGSALGEVALTKGALGFRPSAQHRDFVAWLHSNADDVFSRLHEEFLSQSKKED